MIKKKEKFLIMFKRLTRVDANYQKKNIYNLRLVQMSKRNWRKRKLQN